MIIMYILLLYGHIFNDITLIKQGAFFLFSISLGFLLGFKFIFLQHGHHLMYLVLGAFLPDLKITHFLQLICFFLQLLCFSSFSLL